MEKENPQRNKALLRKIAAVAKNEDTVQAVTRTLDLYLPFGITLFVSDAFDKLIYPKANMPYAIKRIAAILAEVSPQKLASQLPKETIVETPILSLGQQLAQLIAIMAERTEEYDAIIAAAECLKRYILSKNFDSIYNLFRILAYRISVAEPFLESYYYSSETIKLVARRFREQKIVKAVEKTKKDILHEWLYSGLSLSDEETRSYYLNYLGGRAK